MARKSYWMASAKLPRFPKLGKDLKVDVIVVGGGITGVTAAYLLKKAGKKVALLEKDRCARSDTGHTTAHLTYVTDLRPQELVKDFGRDHAQAAWDAGRAAMDQIQSLVEQEKIACEFTRVPGYLHSPWKDPPADAAEQLQKDAALAKELGFDATYMDNVPFVNRPGIRFANQAKFHPLQYLATLVERIPGDGSYVFENTEADEFINEPTGVKANGHTLSGDYTVIATHVPLMGKAGLISAAFFQTKLAPYSSYAIGARVPKGTIPQALFWDTADPYYYLRVDQHLRHDYVILGGEDHKTGQENDPEAAYRRLEELLASFLPAAKVNYHWTGQVVETHDGLPFIGETAKGQFAGTGFAGNGMTFGTLTAMMSVDAVLGKKNPWSDLFDVNRKKLAGAWDYIKENIDYPYYFIKDKLASAEGSSVDILKVGEGKILKLNGEKVAVYRTPQNGLVKVSPVCTHMGCLVHWNPADSTWDCPCHGSRFQPSGEVLAGPAEAPLAKVPAEEKETSRQLTAKTK